MLFVAHNNAKCKEREKNGPCFIFNIGGWQIGDSNRKDDCSKDMLFNNEELVHFRSAPLEEFLAFSSVPSNPLSLSLSLSLSLTLSLFLSLGGCRVSNQIIHTRVSA